MCYASSCDPTCGKCKPKAIIRISCPECGAPVQLLREEYLNIFSLPHKKNIMEKKLLERGAIKEPVCAVCNCSLLEAFRQAVKPLPCQKSQIVCGYPCGGRFDPYVDDGYRCQTMVPVGTFNPDEVDFSRTGNI